MMFRKLFSRIPYHTNFFFYEKALFVKPTWRPYIVTWRNCCALRALCFYPHFR